LCCRCTHPPQSRIYTLSLHDALPIYGAKYGCCVANGTIALVVALQAAGIKFGDEVIVPAYTWDGTAAAVLFAGGIPVFADIDPEDRKSTRLNSSHGSISYAVFCLKKT